MFAENVQELTPGTAVDIACGEGRNALWLAEQGWTVTALDFSKVAIHKARQIAEQRDVEVNWLVEDAASFELPIQAYDLVVLSYLHTNPAERKTWLPNAVNSVKQAGTFIYIGHDPSNIHSGVGGPQNPNLLPAVDEIASALSGFRVDVASVVERPIVNEPGHRAELTGTALDSLVIAVRQ